MGLADRPLGGVVFHTKRCHFEAVSLREENNYILPDPDAFPANQPRTYTGNFDDSTPFTVARYEKALEELLNL